MKLLIKQARVIDPLSRFNGQTIDLLIQNGIIQQIGDCSGIEADQTIDINGLHISPGWVDLFAHFNDPGFEHKETLETGAAAAARGGFTDVLVLPNTQPVVHHKAGVEYIKQKSSSLPVSLHPIGAVTRNTEGKELAEMYDMQQSGAIAFSDGIAPIQSAGLLVKALQYVKAFDGIIIQLPIDKSIQPQGLMHEGIISTQLGLPGLPAMAEEIIVARDIKLARYADSRLHFTGVSSKKSLEYIRRAKESGIKVTCSLTPYHLYFTDEDLVNYDTNLKTNPPIRSAEHRDALRAAVLDGTVDCIASHHLPHEFDSKIVEFETARFGMIGLETAYPVLQTSIDLISPERCVELLSIQPRKILNLPDATIAEGVEACITLFEPQKKWKVDNDSIRSLSKNTPFTGRSLQGYVTGIFNNNSFTAF